MRNGFISQRNMANRRKHEVKPDFIKLKDHHGQTSGTLPYCTVCKEEVVRMMGGNYLHARDAA